MLLKRGNKAPIASSTSSVPACTSPPGPCHSEVTGHAKLSSTQTVFKLLPNPKATHAGVHQWSIIIRMDIAG